MKIAEVMQKVYLCVFVCVSDIRLLLAECRKLEMSRIEVTVK